VCNSHDCVSVLYSIPKHDPTRILQVRLHISRLGAKLARNLPSVLAAVRQQPGATSTHESTVGNDVGDGVVGNFDGDLVVGPIESVLVGARVGYAVGVSVGRSVGVLVGDRVAGARVGDAKVGETVAPLHQKH
jgi:hypothetical protein